MKEKFNFPSHVYNKAERAEADDDNVHETMKTTMNVEVHNLLIWQC